MLGAICTSNTTCPRAAALAGILTLALPTALWAGTTIKVPRPNGVDDTANLQAALDLGASAGPGAIVQLAAGTYRTKQLVAYNFQGAFRGAGQGATTIVAKPHLPVNVPDSGFWPLPDASTSFWPVLITFVNGDIHVSDMTLKVTATNGTATTNYKNPTWGNDESGMYDIILFTGDAPTNALLERVTMEGVQDANYWWGSNVAMGVDYSAYCPSSDPSGYAWMSGNYTVRNCTFKNMFNATSFDGRHRDCQVVIGGSPGAGNVGMNLMEGIDLELAESSMVEVSFNQMSVGWVGLWEVNWYSMNLGGFVPATPSYFFIHDNTFNVSGAPGYSGFAGITIRDDPASPWIRASIYNNLIKMRVQASDGISIQGTRGTSIWQNTITGFGSDAIALTQVFDIDGNVVGGSTSQATVDNNNLSGFTASVADIVIDSVSNDNRVTCTSAKDTVDNSGLLNTISVLPPASNQNQQ